MSRKSPIPVNARHQFALYMALHDDPALSERKRFEQLEGAAARFCRNNQLNFADSYEAAHQYLRMKQELDLAKEAPEWASA